ncbi:hypothetical protein D3C71_1432430 [compost metagenome]
MRHRVGQIALVADQCTDAIGHLVERVTQPTDAGKARQPDTRLQVALPHVLRGGLQRFQVAPDRQRPQQHEAAQEQAQRGINANDHPGADKRFGGHLDQQPLRARPRNGGNKAHQLVTQEEPARIDGAPLLIRQREVRGVVVSGVQHLQGQAVMRRQRVAHIIAARLGRHVGQFLLQAV